MNDIENKEIIEKHQVKQIPEKKTFKVPETRMFISYGNEEVTTLFAITKGAKIPDFQRCIGMATGKLLEINEKGKNGVIEIEGFKYQIKDNREIFRKKKYSLTNFINKDIMFTFYPTITEKGIQLLKQKPDSPVVIKIANLKKGILNPNCIEVIGIVKQISDSWFKVAIQSKKTKKHYVVYIFGRSEEVKIKDFITANCKLKDGLIWLEKVRIFQNI